MRRQQVGRQFRHRDHNNRQHHAACGDNPQPARPGHVNAHERRRERAERRHQDQSRQPEHAVHQYDRCGEGLRAGGRRRVGNAHDVAADVARQEVVKEQAHPDRFTQRARGHVHMLRAQQAMPSPHRDRLHEGVGSDGQQDPPHVHALHALPERCEIDRSQHEVQQRGAYQEAYENLQQWSPVSVARKSDSTLTALGSVRYNDSCAS